jgi:Rieske Fe-S protein
MIDRASNNCPSVSAQPNDADKRLWLIATGVVGGIGTLAAAVPFVASFAPNERAEAGGGPVEADLSDIPLGGSKAVEWRGKPAPTNLEIPPYRYASDTRIVVGNDTAA